MYKIKQILEDFMVWEMPLYELSETGVYSYFWLRKRNYNTIDAIKKIAFKLNVPLKNIGFAGTKDKAAITEQIISIRAISLEKINKLNLNDIELDYVGKGETPISLGDLKGNRFRIVVRNLDKRFKVKTSNKIPNLFGPQRFSKNNSEIGKALVQKNFKKATDLINQYELKEYLVSNPADFAGALRTIPLKTRKMYVHAYQSYLWNKTVEEYLKTNPFKNEVIPLIGFNTQLKNDKISAIIRDLMNHEGITQRDFIIPQIPELTSEGNYRELFIKPESFQIKQEPDELNKEKIKATVTFTLPKGSYATVVVDYLFS